MILITGASAGIGEATAHAFAKSGRELIVTARRGDRLQALASRLQSETPAKVSHFVLDVRDPAQIDRFVSSQGQLLERLTVLVNNAGLARGIAPLQTGNPQDWDEMIDTNLKGLLRMTRAILPFFLQKKSGHIVNLGSVAGRYTYPGGNVYCATKWAVRALNESLRLDLNGTGIRVTEISPGLVETEFSQVRLKDEAKAKAVYQGMTPLRAADVAQAIVWAVDQPRHVNIQEIVMYPTDQASPGLVHREPKT